MTKKTRIILFTTLGILVTLIAAFTAYVAYFALSHKALPGTQVGNVSVVGKTEPQITDDLVKAAKHKVTFEAEHMSPTTVDLETIGYISHPEKTAAEALKFNQQPLAYLSGLFTTHRVDPMYSEDPAKVNTLSTRLSKNLPNAQAATEPKVEHVPNSATFKIVEGKDGYGVDTQSLLDGAQKVIAERRDVSHKVTTGTIQPLASREDAKALGDKAEALAAGRKVALQVGSKPHSAEKNTIASWIITENVSKRSVPKIDKESVAEWVDKMKPEIEVARVDGFRYVHPDKKVLKVKEEMRDGVSVANAEQVVAEIARELEANKNYSGKLETKVDKAQWKEKIVDQGAENLVYWASPGEKWIDVNISNRSVTAYEGGKKVLGPYPSVTGKASTPTIQGIFKVERAYRSKTMRGDDYVTPNVPWAQYFSGGYAIHGAYWRSSFGPNASGVGSHGCVNLPVPASKELYKWGGIGTVVVSHR